ncbi:MAG: cyclic nucleotide-binding domain-containing protein, partial [Rhodoferax sp.]|nr:cyclic nucleotide-binding domain-containing protein [Rhodoferax sp.]
PIPPKPATPSLRLDPAIVKKIAERVAIFSHMPQDALLATLALGEVRPFKAGEVLFREKEMGTSFYVVIVGAVNVQKARDGQSLVVASLGVGECFGEMALVRDDLRTASVVAQTDCVTLCFERAKIDAYASISALVYKNIAGVLARRLDERNISFTDLMVKQRGDAAAS